MCRPSPGTAGRAPCGTPSAIRWTTCSSTRRRRRRPAALLAQPHEPRLGPRPRPRRRAGPRGRASPGRARRSPRAGCRTDGCRILLLTQPRFLGYVFNPVSFWLVHRGEALVAVIAEVSNTYGDRHSYLCHRPGFAADRGRGQHDRHARSCTSRRSWRSPAATTSASTSAPTASRSASPIERRPRGAGRDAGGRPPPADQRLDPGRGGPAAVRRPAHHRTHPLGGAPPHA